MPTEPVADRTLLIDVEHQGRRRYIGCCLLVGPAGAALVDPGPAASLPGLERGLEEAGVRLEELDAILLTHIHLDHAGATGTLVRRNPGLRVYVHERGAPHVVDPARLLRSARRLYGDELEGLWGEVVPVPEGNVVPLAGGERLRLAGRALKVAHTPGHASHHVSYLDTSTGVAFVGDTAGIRIANAGYVLPVTPPPEVDLAAWWRSLDAIEGWRPGRLLLTHFGAAQPVPAHLAEFRERLRRWAESVRLSLDGEAPDARRAAEFARQVGEELDRALGPQQAALYGRGGAPELSWHGLARYWRRAPSAGPAAGPRAAAPPR